jgi:uncharacterized membrane protein YfcA
MDRTFWLLEGSALAAGIINSIAGGGTLLTFSALLAVVPPVEANATSTVALVPGSLAGGWGYRRELSRVRSWLSLLALPSLLGGLVGALLVTCLDPAYFSLLVPWLLLAAAMLFLMQPALARLAGSSTEQAAPSRLAKARVAAFQFLIAVYGGYFGAGIGILMLASLGALGLSNIHYMNALKAVLAALINGISVLIFVVNQKVIWTYALSMAATAIIGGYLGAYLARRTSPVIVRWIIILIGFSLAAFHFYKQFGPAHSSY